MVKSWHGYSLEELNNLPIHEWWGLSAGDKQRLNRRKRQLRLEKARSIATHADEEWDLLVRLTNLFCYSCGHYFCSLTKDHIVPICHGGSDGIYNLQPICSRCNSGKGSERIDYIYHLRPPEFRRPPDRPPVRYYIEPFVPPPPPSPEWPDA